MDLLGCDEGTLGPPVCSSNLSAAASIASRICSASSRRSAHPPKQPVFWIFLESLLTGRMQSRLLIGAGCDDQLVQFLEAPTFLDEVGCKVIEKFRMEGGPVSVPKSLVWATRPRPKCCCHTRLTMTRAVKGFCGSAIHRANVSRRPVVPGCIGGRIEAGFSSSAVGILRHWPKLLFLRNVKRRGTEPISEAVIASGRLGLSASYFANSCMSLR